MPTKKAFDTSHVAKLKPADLKKLKAACDFEVDKLRQVERAKVHKKIKEKLGKLKSKASVDCTIKFTAEMSLKNIRDAIDFGGYIEKDLKIKNVKATGKGIGPRNLASCIKDCLIYDYEDESLRAIFPEQIDLIDDLQEELDNDLDGI